jgi:hypothetical protein
LKLTVNEPQADFCSLLNYFSQGDFATFQRLHNLTFSANRAVRPYEVANMLHASNIVGLVEVEDGSHSRVWCSTEVRDPVIHSAIPKTIGTSAKWFKRHSATVVPLVADFHDRALIYGSPHAPGSDTTGDSIFGDSFWSYFPAFRDADPEICEREEYHTEFDKPADIFKVASAAWNPLTVLDAAESGLYRCRRQFGAFDHFVIRTDARIRFRITQAEWAFVASLRLLGWPLDSVLRFDGDRLIVPRVMRLPTLLLRYIFASSVHSKVGPTLEFSGLHENSAHHIREYFRGNNDF